jgi:hypothetical protein
MDPLLSDSPQATCVKTETTELAQFWHPEAAIDPSALALNVAASLFPPPGHAHSQLGPAFDPDLSRHHRSNTLTSSSSSSTDGGSGYDSSDSGQARFGSEPAAEGDSNLEATPGLLYQDHSKGPKRPMNAFMSASSPLRALTC